MSQASRHPRRLDSRVPYVSSAAHHGRVWRAFWMAAAALLATTAAGLSDPPGEAWSRVPAGAQGAISGALGRDDRSYHAAAALRGLRAANPRHELSIDFSPEGVRIGDPSDSILLSLRSVGRGEMQSPVAAAEPAARANRIEYCRENMTEWYLNGPFGLEQGFTFESAPIPDGSGPLTLTLAIAGELAAEVRADGKGVTLARAGRPALAYEGLSALDSSGRDLPARLDLAEGALRLEVDDTDARYPIVVDPFLFKASLFPSDFDESIQQCCSFGLAVAVSGNAIVVGAPNTTSLLPGLAYVFVKPLAGWSGNLVETAKLVPSVRETADFFGSSVGIDGDTVVVGSRKKDLGTNGDQGAAYVFTKPGSGWAGTLTENATLTSSDGAAGDEFGSSAAINGDTVVIGAPLDDHPTGIITITDGGSAYVFVKPGAGWAGALNESAKLRASAGLFGAFSAGFGSSVGVSGDAVVGGAPFQDIGGNLNQGAAYVFAKPVSGWSGVLTQAATLNAPAGAPGDRAGTSVAISGDAAFVGVPGENFFFIADAGAAYVFVKPGGGWSGTPAAAARLSASSPQTNDLFGLHASASGNRVVFSVDVNANAYYFFIKPSGGWAGSLTQTEKINSTGAALEFIGLSGNTLVAGADGLNTAAVFVRSFIVIFLNPRLLSGRAFNSGSTIPVEFQLTGEDGIPISDAEAETMASNCDVRISFSGEGRSGGCATYDRRKRAFAFDLKTPKGLAPGTYRVTVEVVVEGGEVTAQSVDVMTR
jgi:FG-GAP repeat